MSYESIRPDIVPAIEAAKAGFSLGYGLVIEYDNVIIVDTKTQTDPFLSVEIKLLTGDQAALATNPEKRVWGSLVLAAAVPEGSGTSKAFKLLDWFVPALQRKEFGKVRTQMGTYGPKRPHLGWVYYPAVIPFWSDQPS